MVVKGYILHKEGENVSYELFLQGPATYIPVILMSLLVTVIAYGAIPLIVAMTRRQSVTARKYTTLCYALNLLVVILFIALNGKSNGAAYVLWTGIFSGVGVKLLRKKGVLETRNTNDSFDINQSGDGSKKDEEYETERFDSDGDYVKCVSDWQTELDESNVTSTYKARVLRTTTNEKYFFNSETKSFELRKEYKEKRRFPKIKIFHIVVFLLIVETLYIVCSNVLPEKTVQTVTTPTPVHSFTTPKVNPTPYVSSGDYWEDAVNELIAETNKKNSDNESKQFINGKILVEPHSPCVCPMTVSVRGDDSYYVYMESLSSWNDDLSFMIDANSTVNIDVPLGSYDVYYATGNFWYGQVDKFGPETQYYKLNDVLDFTYDGEYYYGHELELWKQVDGNLGESIVGASDFPG